VRPVSGGVDCRQKAVKSAGRYGTASQTLPPELCSLKVVIDFIGRWRNR